MKPTAYIAINGIHSDPGASDGWTDRFVTWMHLMGQPCVAEKWEYYTFFALRWLRQGARARAITAKVREYQEKGHRVVLVGHSNGCDLIGRVLAEADIRVDAAHLIAPATDEALFVDALARGTVRRIHTYGSRRDGALRLARWTKFSVGSVHLGYGSMGLRCREFAAQFPGVVFDHSDDRQDHSTWFSAEASGFQQTMRTILAADRADRESYGEGPEASGTPDLQGRASGTLALRVLLLGLCLLLPACGTTLAERLQLYGAGATLLGHPEVGVPLDVLGRRMEASGTLAPQTAREASGTLALQGKASGTLALRKHEHTATK